MKHTKIFVVSLALVFMLSVVPSGLGAGNSYETQGGKLVIYEFGDFECPYCAQQSEAINEIRDNYASDVIVKFKHFPLPFHTNAQMAAEAAECARDQGEFWDYHDLLFANQANLDREALIGFADDLDLNIADFTYCLDNNKKKSVVQNDYAFGETWGVTATPTVFIGGQHGEKVTGAHSYADFKEIIEDYLDGNVPPESYDLEITSVSQSSSVDVGEKAYFGVVVENNGNADANDVKVWLTISSLGLEDEEELDIDAGEDESVQLSVLIPSNTNDGYYSFTVYAIDKYGNKEDTSSGSIYVSGHDGSYSFSVNTDKSEYRVGEKAKIVATLKSDYVDVSTADVYAKVEYPNGRTNTIKLDATICSTSPCNCPIYRCEYDQPCPAIQCICDSSSSCQFEKSISVTDAGAHYINAYVSEPDIGASDETKFLVYTSSDTIYVNLNEKFELEEDQSAVVVDFGDMRITLDDILIYRCGVSDSTTSSGSGSGSTQPSVVSNSGSGSVQPTVASGSGSGMMVDTIRCLDESYAQVTVKGPQLWEVGLLDSTTSNVAEPEIAYTETQLTIREGSSVSVFNTEISLIELDNDEGLFLVQRTSGQNYVDVKIDPSRATVELGEDAKYTIKVMDLHEQNVGNSYLLSYEYKLTVLDLPFSTDYPRTVNVGAGETIETTLIVDTSFVREALTYSNANTGISPVIESVQDTGVTAKVIAENTAEDMVEIAPSIVASGRTYKFRVLVTGSDGSEATAYALLNVLYSPPPPPQDGVRIPIEEGWNLITLPGDGELSAGTCSESDGLYAFVYIKSVGDYMTMEEAERYMGQLALEQYLKENAFWIYSYNDCLMSFQLEEATSYNDLDLDSGWNFVPITQDMEGNSLSNIGGNCEFQKVYRWDAQKQDWKTLGNGEKIKDEWLYTGFVAKVENSCGFGWGAIIAPPPLPQ